MAEHSIPRYILILVPLVFLECSTIQPRGPLLKEYTAHYQMNSHPDLTISSISSFEESEIAKIQRYKELAFRISKEQPSQYEEWRDRELNENALSEDPVPIDAAELDAAKKAERVLLSFGVKFTAENFDYKTGDFTVLQNYPDVQPQVNRRGFYFENGPQIQNAIVLSDPKIAYGTIVIRLTEPLVIQQLGAEKAKQIMQPPAEGGRPIMTGMFRFRGTSQEGRATVYLFQPIWWELCIYRYRAIENQGNVYVEDCEYRSPGSPPIPVPTINN